MTRQLTEGKEKRIGENANRRQCVEAKNKPGGEDGDDGTADAHDAQDGEKRDVVVRPVPARV